MLKRSSHLEKVQSIRRSMKIPFFSEIAHHINYILQHMRVQRKTAKSVVVYALILIERVITKTQAMGINNFKKVDTTELYDLIVTSMQEKNANLLSENGGSFTDNQFDLKVE